MFPVIENVSIGEYAKKKKQLSKLKRALPEVLKVGRYCRLSNDVPNIDIDNEEANVQFYAEWKDEVRPGYGGEWSRMGWRNLTEQELALSMEGGHVPRIEEVKAQQPFDDFNLNSYFRMLTKWHEVRSLKSGERAKVVLNTWGKLKELKE